MLYQQKERQRQERIERLQAESLLSLQEQIALRDLERQRQKLEEEKIALVWKKGTIEAREEALKKEKEKEKKYIEYRKQLEKDIQDRARKALQGEKMNMTMTELQLNRTLLERQTL